jgi:tryptophan halogenase
MAEKLKDLVILGGGTAGWLCAAILSKRLAGHSIQVSLVESEEIGLIGVGEATIPPIRAALSFLGIDEIEFVKATQGSFKLGIEFVDWLRLDHAYLHPFGAFGADWDGVPFHQHFLRYRALGGSIGYQDFSLTALAAKTGKFCSSLDTTAFHRNWNYAFHFDSALAAPFFRNYAQAHGVRRIEGVVEEANQDDDGYITALALQDGTAVNGDFFIDCSGFRSKLLGETLNTPFEDWSDVLFCDTAVAAPSKREEPARPYTRAVARDAGWQWEIPLAHRNGNGYVFSSRHTDVEAAKNTLIGSLGDRIAADPRVIRFKPGRRSSFWVKNCVAIGLAAGFLEPLESTAIHLSQLGVFWLLPFIPNYRPCAEEIALYNQQMAAAYEQAKQFILLHYLTSQRSDTDFWRDCAAVTPPDALASRIRAFDETGRCFIPEGELFSQGSWLAVMMGQGIDPRSYPFYADAGEDRAVSLRLQNLQSAFIDQVARMPLHEAAIE